MSRKYLFLAGMISLANIMSCSKPYETLNKTSKDQHQQTAQVNYRQELRTFIQDLSAWARIQKPGFLVVAQNSSELLTASGMPQDPVITAYVNAIDGMGREELLYGYNNNDDVPTPAAIQNEWLSFCKLGNANHLTVLTTDYCFTPAKMADSYKTNEGYGFISFAATHRQLDNIPAGAPYHENVSNILTLKDAKNFLYTINHGDPAAFITSVKATNYDVLIIDAFSGDGKDTWSKSVLNSLKTKSNGGKRLVLAYMSIGQAEQYRWYWKAGWATNPPAWKDNYYVRYWMPEWKALIYGNANAYTQKIIDAGFDGTYLDPVDGSSHWEEQ
jgi:cysteinyl-tRNA synthetase